MLQTYSLSLKKNTHWDVILRVAEVARYKHRETDSLRRGCKGCKGFEVQTLRDGLTERWTDWDVVARVARVARYKHWEMDWLRRGCKGCNGFEVQTLRDGLTETWLQGLQRLRGIKTERRTDWDVVARVARVARYEDWEMDWLRRGCKGCEGCEVQTLRDGLYIYCIVFLRAGNGGRFATGTSVVAFARWNVFERLKSKKSRNSKVVMCLLSLFVPKLRSKVTCNRAKLISTGMELGLL